MEGVAVASIRSKFFTPVWGVLVTILVSLMGASKPTAWTYITGYDTYGNDVCSKWLTEWAFNISLHDEGQMLMISSMQIFHRSWYRWDLCQMLVSGLSRIVFLTNPFYLCSLRYRAITNISSSEKLQKRRHHPVCCSIQLLPPSWGSGMIVRGYTLKTEDMLFRVSELIFLSS